MITLAFAVAASGAALAQTGYTYQSSGLEYTGEVPVEAGQVVRGLIQLNSGMIALGDVKVEGLYADDLFAYWGGIFNSEPYYYDVYSRYWKPGPITYTHATLNFQGQLIEGLVRSFGRFSDYDHFYGSDGVLYQRVNIYKRHRRRDSARRTIAYTYFVNMQTGERSDGEGPAYTVIGDPEVAAQVIEEQRTQQEEALRTIVENNPAFPMWQLNAYDAPEVIPVPAVDPNEEQPTLMQLIEEEIGPLTVGQETEAEEETE
jgi:hypothetical protein